ncbi:MAG: hypothetical protein ACD_3C00228G0002 [uncultured bacterium (gcode 4)]|uniref:Uncharacterized protein n=1 Tax=uncultured bacterium (gcode 4) TaxID=1234023 RepID=K2FZC4_9BACT|nr:MAG: hypothetical protein ACD_3C00228G0002 [uncultured bacterium (gcode 4)]
MKNALILFIVLLFWVFNLTNTYSDSNSAVNRNSSKKDAYKEIFKKQLWDKLTKLNDQKKNSLVTNIDILLNKYKWNSKKINVSVQLTALKELIVEANQKTTGGWDITKSNNEPYADMLKTYDIKIYSNGINLELKDGTAKGLENVKKDLEKVRFLYWTTSTEKYMFGRSFLGFTDNSDMKNIYNLCLDNLTPDTKYTFSMLLFHIKDKQNGNQEIRNDFAPGYFITKNDNSTISCSNKLNLPIDNIDNVKIKSENTTAKIDWEFSKGARAEIYIFDSPIQFNNSQKSINKINLDYNKNWLYSAEFKNLQKGKKYYYFITQDVEKADIIKTWEFTID